MIKLKDIGYTGYYLWVDRPDRELRVFNGLRYSKDAKINTDLLEILQNKYLWNKND